jgi:hypothetical protein
MNMQKMSWTKQHDGLLGMSGKGDDTFKFDIPEGYQFAGFDAKVLAGKYGEGLRVSEKPGRGTTGKDKQAKVHWWFDGGSQPFIKYRATATFIDGAIEKEQRALLIVCDLAYGGAPQFKTLYEWIESAGLMTVKYLLKDDYKHVTSLADQDATATNFVNSLATLAGKQGVSAVDAILMLHGQQNRIIFRDRSLTGGTGGTIRSELGAENLGSKLRACFSTCCWGRTVADDLVAAGFRVACGAKDVYANGTYGIPAALHSWESGATFARAVANANNQTVLAVSDAIARHMAPLFATANSYWTISGKKYTRITSQGK